METAIQRQQTAKSSGDHYNKVDSTTNTAATCLSKIDKQLNKGWYNDDCNSIPQAENKLIQSMNDDINNFILLQQKSIRQFDLDVQNIFRNMNNDLKSVLTTVENKNNVNTNTSLQSSNDRSLADANTICTSDVILGV